VTEWQSADERNNREKIDRARQAAEDLFKRAPHDTAAELSTPAPNHGSPIEPQPRRQPRIFTIPPQMPRSAEIEVPVEAKPMPRRPVARRPTGAVPPSQIGRVRALATYGMTQEQVADLYGVTVGEIERILRGPLRAGKAR
jgi:hypothetical protein